MASGGSGGILDGKIPVFVYPVQIDFYLEDTSTHKRVVTIYNPYEFDVTFKVLCNNPKKYAVVEPEGKICGQKCVDIVIRHVAVSPQTVDTTDKFRITLFEEGTNEMLGKKDILALLHAGLPDPKSNSLGDKQRKALGGVFPSLGQGGDASSGSDNRGGSNPNYMACFVACVCILALFLPTYCQPENETSQSILQDYPWLHLSVHQKLVFSYVLGLVTIAILRT